jgi:hypothetical protein
MKKKLTWEKPILVEIAKTVSKGNAVLCEDICDKGNNARYLCSRGSDNK